jgi:hypothetical protein
MPSLNYQDLKLSLGVFGGDSVHVQLRSLDIHVTEEQLMAMIYPVFDLQEKALHQPVTPTP